MSVCVCERCPHVSEHLREGRIDPSKFTGNMHVDGRTRAEDLGAVM